MNNYKTLKNTWILDQSYTKEKYFVSYAVRAPLIKPSFKHQSYEQEKDTKNHTENHTEKINKQ